MGMLLPLDTTETYEDHFLDRSWTSPADQVAAGYPRFCQPTASTAQFRHTIDVGAILTQSVLVSLNIAKTDIVAGITLTPTISLSTDNATWTDHVGVYNVFSSNFRYVKITLDASGGGTALLRVLQVAVSISIKKKREGAKVQCLAADSGGTTYTFNETFIDVEKIIVTAKHQVAETKGITAVYDFTDVPNPTSCKVLLFSNNSGSRIDGEASIEIEGS